MPANPIMGNDARQDRLSEDVVLGPSSTSQGSGGGGALKSTRYAPGTVSTYTTNNAAFTAIDSANVNTGNFIAPASGSVWVEVALLLEGNAAGSGAGANFALFDHGAVTTQRGDTWFFDVDTTSSSPLVLKFLVTGLTPGNSYNFDLAWAQVGGITLTVQAKAITGVGSTSLPTTAAGPFLSEVRAA